MLTKYIALLKSLKDVVNMVVKFLKEKTPVILLTLLLSGFLVVIIFQSSKNYELKQKLTEKTKIYGSEKAYLVDRVDFLFKELSQVRLGLNNTEHNVIEEIAKEKKIKQFENATCVEPWEVRNDAELINILNKRGFDIFKGESSENILEEECILQDLHVKIDFAIDAGAGKRRSNLIYQKGEEVWKSIVLFEQPLAGPESGCKFVDFESNYNNYHYPGRYIVYSCGWGDAGWGSKIVSALDIQTGEVIENIYSCQTSYKGVKSKDSKFELLSLSETDCELGDLFEYNN